MCEKPIAYNGEILKFEAVCKLLTICLVYPVLGGVYRIYAASEGLNFNSGAAFAFVSPAGVVVLLLVAAAATAFVFWELLLSSALRPLPARARISLGGSCGGAPCGVWVR